MNVTSCFILLGLHFIASVLAPGPALIILTFIAIRRFTKMQFSQSDISTLALIILMIHPLRNNIKYLTIACVLGFVGIWLEKGMGLVVPGFIPTALGEVFEYTPTALEINVGLGIWAFGILVC